jgi:hypothetical protein
MEGMKKSGGNDCRKYSRLARRRKSKMLAQRELMVEVGRWRLEIGMLTLAVMLESTSGGEVLGERKLKSEWMESRH